MWFRRHDLAREAARRIVFGNTGEVPGAVTGSANRARRWSCHLRIAFENRVDYLRNTVGYHASRAPVAHPAPGRRIRATEDDFSLVECMQAAGGAWAVSPACWLKGVFAEALTAYLAVLDTDTLADIVCNRAALRPLLGISKTIA